MMKYPFGKAIVISYNINLTGVCLDKNEEGIIPIIIDEEDISFIREYPNVLEMLKDGFVLYHRDFNTYFGKRSSEGPYAETKVFNSIYECNNMNLFDAVRNIEKDIINKNNHVRKLIRIGDFYTK